MKSAKSVATFLRDEEGLTTVEYAVAGGLIALVVIIAFRALGLTVNNVINNINSALNQ
jgi:pilus assembly protein Flp/PilA